MPYTQFCKTLNVTGNVKSEHFENFIINQNNKKKWAKDCKLKNEFVLMLMCSWEFGYLCTLLFSQTLKWVHNKTIKEIRFCMMVIISGFILAE